TAFIVTSMMRDVVIRGTGALVRSVGFYGDAAGKTGTTSYWRDAWFIGFTGSGLVTAIWFGFDKSTVSMGRGVVGGTVAAPVFGEYMREVYRKITAPPIPSPSMSGIVTVEICQESGKIASPLCTNTRSEFFIVGTEPVEECNVHLKEYVRSSESERAFEFDSKPESEKVLKDDFSDFREDLLRF
ncbi:MAG: carboxypeptidase, partial [Brevinematia bacterium]